MADVFMFSAQPEVNKGEKPPDLSFNAKRARPFDADVIGDTLRKPTVESFKSKLLNASSPGNWQGFGTGVEKLQIEDGDVTITVGPNGPAMKMSDMLKEKLCKPWENALILKNMGRPHTLNFMISKLKQKWPLFGHWQVTDLDDGYFIARFQMREDLESVLIGGPWVIANQYLAVQRWRPNFVPGEDEIRKMMVWVRLSKLPVEWIDVGLLHSIGGMLGTTIKVDPITESQARGRFARICVELDITKPLRSFLEIENRAVRVEYENLGLICFNCGRIGHSREVCKDGTAEKNEEPIILEEQPIVSKMGSDVKEAGSDQFGPWMQVNYGRFSRSHLGFNAAGRKNGFQGNGGRQGFGDRQGSGPSNAASIGTPEVGRKGPLVGRGSMKGVSYKKNGTVAGTEVGGSRFAILNENLEEETSVVVRQEKASSSSILTEISNRSQSNKTNLKPSAYKYLINAPIDRFNHSNRSKENGKEGRIKKSGKGTKKISTPPDSGQNKSMEEDIEDSEVLQNLHKKMVEIRGNESQQAAGSTTPLTDDILTPDSGQQIVTVSGEDNFEVVASKLKEAMEMVLE